MPITQSLNSKANIKKSTSNDLPFSPAQPVLNTYLATSTSNQTAIANLGFTVDTVNNPNAFFLFVDGKKLTQGASNDFTFAAVATDGTSSSIALNQAIPANLNIQAYKLGLKPEAQFGMDNRFTQLYEAQGNAFQGFVNTTSFISVATATTGTPAAGTFYSSIVGRAPMVDLSQDLKARFGIDRIMTQQIQQLQNEFGPNGEPVWATPNDTNGQIRFVGNWSSSASINGNLVLGGANTTDYIEITFYGTGLNILTPLFGAGWDIRSSLDGGTETSNITAGTYASVLGNRNYSTNQVLPVYSGLALGIHTVKLRQGASQSMGFQGFEVINANSTSLINVNPGVAYNGGQKLTNGAQSVFAYNSVATGTRGGRVLVYQKADGSIGQAWQAVNAAQANLSSADHTNEEIARTYNWREFGAGRSDDFSNNTSAAKAFTLDDGTTTLISNNAAVGSNNLLYSVGTNSFVTLTFVGTGLDIVAAHGAAGTSDTMAFYVDGNSVGTISGTANTNTRFIKIASGLSYGTHTVKIVNTTYAQQQLMFQNFVVYQPRKPVLPAGAVELADYNVMANFVANTVAAVTNISQGTLRKANTREITYVDGTGGTTSWSIGTVDPASHISGFDNNSDRLNAYVQLPFFGFGFDFRFQVSTNRSANISVTLNGTLLTTANFPTAVFTTYGGVTFTAGTGILNQNAASQVGAGFTVSGLPLAEYVVKFNNNAGGSYLAFGECIDIITPIHSAKSNVASDLQNTLPIGSQGISDNRKLSAVKDTLSATKVWAQAVGVANGPSTTATSPVPMPDMSITIKTSGGPAEIKYSVGFAESGNINAFFLIYVDGVSIGNGRVFAAPIANNGYVLSDMQVVVLSAGVHKVDIYWYTSSGTLTAISTGRTLIVREL
jgi:hypothetical protein